MIRREFPGCAILFLLNKLACHFTMWKALKFNGIKLSQRYTAMLKMFNMSIS